MTEEVLKGAEELAEVLWENRWEEIAVYDGRKEENEEEATNYCW
jgi:hypothetical protein